VTDRIVLHDLAFVARHGVHADERRYAQPFHVDVELELDLAPAGASDDLAATVDYAAVVGRVRAVVEGPGVDLVETLAARIAAAVLDAYPVDAVVVRVRKPGVDLGVPAAWAGVEIRRVRGVEGAGRAS
jgi:dihydroneopterin aldolase